MHPFAFFKIIFVACRLICHTNILSLSLSIQPLINSSYCLPLVCSCPYWLQGIFQSSKHPAAFSTFPLLASGTEKVSPWLPCLLLPACWRQKVLLTFSMHLLLYCSSTGSSMPGKHSERSTASSGSLKGLVFYKAQHGHWECLISSCVCCFPFCSLGVPGNVCNAWLYGERRQGLL